jgi:anion-transporting  ArsA/GET3 family ATPase
MSAMTISRLIREKRVVVCCGAGGVGKTTVSAAMALAAARAGRRVLVITIDPSRRLAETLGVDRDLVEAVALSPERARAVGIEEPGRLSTWMLDPQRISNRVVKRLSSDPAKVQALLENRVYKNITAMIAGMQEYTAVEALHEFVTSGKYDLVILDTPPSRNALRFLDAPSRAGTFLDRRIFRLFVPGEENLIRQAASRIIEKVLDITLGEGARKELQEFFQLFEGILLHLNRNQGEMKRFFAGDEISFVLVVSPTQAAVEEAFYFEQKTRELELPLAGFVLNRSLAWASGRQMPSRSLLDDDASEVEVSAVRKMGGLAKPENDQIMQHLKILEDLQQHSEGKGFAWVLPELPAEASDLEALSHLAEHLSEERPQPKRKPPRKRRSKPPMVSAKKAC